MRQTAGQIAWWPVGLITFAQVSRALLSRLLLIVAIFISLGSLLQACGGGGEGAPSVTNLTAITIDPVDSSIAVGTKVQLHATGIYKNKTTKDITDSVTWASANTNVATVNDAAGTKDLASGGSVGVTTITAEQGGKTGVSSFNVTPAKLTSITIEPVNPVVAKGTKVQLGAVGNFSDGSTQDLTTQVNWTSGNGSIARVGSASATAGLVAGLIVGNTSITATLSGVQGATAATVTGAMLTSLTLATDPSIAKGTMVQLTATGNFSDGTTEDLTSQVTWISADNKIARVSNTVPAKGLITGLSVGSSSISATLNSIQGSTTVIVTAATLSSLTVTPPTPSIVNGTTLQLTATGNFSDGTTEDLTSQVSWTSGNNATAQVSDVSATTGLVTGLGVGSTSITATLNGIHGFASLTVTSATLTSLTITPPASSIAKGTTLLLSATGNFSDGTTGDLTRQVSWTSGNNAIAQVSNVSGTDGLVTGLGVGSTSITVTLNGIHGSARVTVTSAALTSLTITPPNPSIAKGATVQLRATGIFSDKSSEDLTSQVSWTSANNAIAQVSDALVTKGLVTALAVGSTPITVTLDGIHGSTSLIVTLATLTAITITPPASSIAKATTAQLAATCDFSDGTAENCTTQVSWTSGDNTVAQVSAAFDTEGLVTALAVGSTSIFATLDGIRGSAPLTVTAAALTAITITPPAASIAKGTPVQLAATCDFSDGTIEDCTSQVSWTSADITTAQVSDALHTKGLVTGINVGSTSILATFEGIRGSAPLTLTTATLTSLVVTPPNSSIAAGTSLQMTATGVFSDGTTEDLTGQAEFISSGSNVLVADDIFFINGLMVGVNPGSATVTANFGGVLGSTVVTVTPATLTAITVDPVDFSIAMGASRQVTATGHYTDGTTEDLTKQVSWISANDAIVQVSNVSGTEGQVTGLSGGSTSIIATFKGMQGLATVGVTAATLTSLSITVPASSIAKGTTLQVTVTGTFSDGSTEDLTDQVSWTSGNNTIGQISDVLVTKGLITGLGAGSTSIIATLNGIQASVTVTVTPATLIAITITPPASSIAKGTSEKLAATCEFSDGTTQNCTTHVSWTSGDNAVAQVSGALDSEGLVTGLNVGSISIFATLEGIQGSAALTVTAAALTAITITPPAPSIATGTPVHLAATCDFSDGTIEDCTTQVSWTPGDITIAQVSDALHTKGLVTGMNVGNTSIFATLDGIQGSATLTVTGAVLTSLIVAPPNPSIAAGTSLQMTATGIFSDGTIEDLTAEAEFISSDPNVLVADDILFINGLMVGVSPGSATVTANFGGVLGSTVVAVTPATLTAITVDPVDFSIAKGTAQQVIATGDFSDGTTEDLTNQVSWTSGNNAIAQVSNVSGTEGLVTGLSVGSTSIIATFKGMQALATVNVTAATLTSLNITVPVSSIAKGTTVQPTITGNFSDGTTEDLTDQVSWTSANNAIGQVSDVLVTKGLVTGLSVGSTSIIVTLNGIQASATITVTAATLTAITVTPSASSIAEGIEALLTATGNFSDGSTEDLTNQVSWTSGNNFIAEVSNALTSKGLVTGLGVGGTSITATLNGVHGSATVDVTGATLTSIVVAPSNLTVSAKTKDVQMTATGIFSDGTTQDLTQQVSWISSNTGVAHILSTSSQVHGDLIPRKPGTTTITAVLAGLQGSTVVTVTL